MNPEQWLSLKWNGGSTMSDRWLNQSKIIQFATRFIGRVMIDGTKLYNLVIVNYTHYVAAACIFMLFSIIFSKAKMLKIVQLVDDISFEIYLCHYMFIVGPVSVMYITGNWIIKALLRCVLRYYLQQYYINYRKG